MKVYFYLIIMYDELFKKEERELDVKNDHRKEENILFFGERSNRNKRSSSSSSFIDSFHFGYQSSFETDQQYLSTYHQKLPVSFYNQEPSSQRTTECNLANPSQKG